METHLNNKSIPSLCFNREDFMLRGFSVDKFVSEYRKYASLETMREDLNIYHKILCTAMVELINEDYADFVNLSSNLVGLDKSIKNLTSPLQSLKKEVEQIKNNLHGTLDTANNMFSERASNHASKILIHHVLCVMEGLEKIKELNTVPQTDEDPLNLEMLERMAFSFNVVQFHMCKITGVKGFADSEKVVNDVGKSILNQLENVFLQSLPSHNIINLEKILRIYAVISAENKVEKCFGLKVVRPFLKDVITQSNITKNGLTKVYKDILSFIPNHCKDILKVTSRHDRQTEIVPGYNFLVNAVWPEIIHAFQYIDPVYLYSLGDPQLFHQNYSASMKFLDDFEHYCDSQSSVKLLRAQSSYRGFIEKWNLDVYFQIRFQEIAGQLEESLEESFVKSDGKSQYLLHASCSLFNCLKLCWSNNIYLPPLKSYFWKLFLQLLSRYKKWTDYNLNSIEPDAIHIAMLIKDLELLVSDVQTLFHETVCAKLANGSERDSIQVAFDEARNALQEISPFAGKFLVKILSEKCTVHLKLIANIPQRYRKTNREIPSKPSPYVSQVLNPLTEFLMESNSILPKKWSKYCELEVTDDIMKQCTTLMKDVLTSIKKMEDSLKILKRARDKPSGQFSSGAVTDDDKIRRQLAIDVNYFEELIQKSGLQASDIKSLKDLKELVISAERVPGLPTNS